MPCLMQTYNEKVQAKQGKIQNIQFEEQRIIRKCGGANSSGQGDKSHGTRAEENC